MRKKKKVDLNPIICEVKKQRRFAPKKVAEINRNRWPTSPEYAPKGAMGNWSSQAI
ncbi:MAG: hypothetical protein ACKVE4_00655 [Dissulfuribacterales bacterium]